MSASVKRLVPLLNRVLIKKPDPPTKSAGGILLPENKKQLQGVVVAMGPRCAHDDDGHKIETGIKPGDHVILPDYGGTKVEADGGEVYYLYRATEILAKVDQDE